MLRSFQGIMFLGNILASPAVYHKSPYLNVAKSDLRGDSEDQAYWSLKTVIVSKIQTSI